MIKLLCAVTIIINNTSVWNKTDSSSLSSAKKRCVTMFADSPCLKKFIKKEHNVYWAICTGEKK
jgi:hypothetical protein